MKILLFLIIGLPLVIFVLGRTGALRGQVPGYIGITDGKLARPALGKTNSVASQHQANPADYHSIAPLKTGSDPQATMKQLSELVKSLPACTIVRSEPNYLYAQCETKWLRFVDDVEFLLVPEDSAIHVRSASRLGRKDFGVNRARIEQLRGQLTGNS